jgi:hypothetical protein
LEFIPWDRMARPEEVQRRSPGKGNQSPWDFGAEEFGRETQPKEAGDLPQKK